MGFDLNKLLRKSRPAAVKLHPQPQKEEKKKYVEEEEPYQVYIPTYEPESDDEVVVQKVKTSVSDRKVPLNPLSDE